MITLFISLVSNMHPDKTEQRHSQIIKKEIIYKVKFPYSCNSTSGGAVLRSRLVDNRCQVKSPAALVDLAVLSFQRLHRLVRVNTG